LLTLIISGFGFVSLSSQAETQSAACQFSIGDANHDGVINSVDITYLSTIIGTSAAEQCSADCNGDGYLDVRDIACVKNKITVDSCSFQFGDANHDGIISSLDINAIKNCVIMGGCNTCGVDCNGDKLINSADMACVKYNIGTSTPACFSQPGDANRDGLINSTDVDSILSGMRNSVVDSCGYDCNLDGYINVQDVLCVQNKIPTCQYNAGDANHDGSVSILDVNTIKNCILTGGCDLCGADCNGDRVVTNSDYFCVNDKIGTSSQACLFQAGDADHDGEFSNSDIDLMKKNISEDIDNPCGFDCNADKIFDSRDITCVGAKIAPDECAFQAGDANNDGKISVSDIDFVKNCTVTGGCNICGVDCNVDNAINGADMTCIKYKIGSSQVCDFAIGDADHNGVINVKDVDYLNTIFGTQTTDCAADCHVDGYINVLDLIWLRDKLATCEFKPGDANHDNSITIDDIDYLKKIIGSNVADRCGSDCNGDGLLDVRDIVCVSAKITPSPIVATSTACLLRAGDANGDNTVNIQDIAAIKYGMGQTNSDKCGHDCNADGVINVQDVLCVQALMGIDAQAQLIIEKTNTQNDENPRSQIVPSDAELITQIYGEKAAKISDDDKERILYYLQSDVNTASTTSQKDKKTALEVYAAAFNGEQPKKKSDWQDVLRIQNGLFPKKFSRSAETAALKTFRKLYKRNPDFKKAADEKAIKIMAYGVRPTKRDLSKEKVAIAAFRKKMKRNPATVKDWITVNAIAYSGVKI